MTDARVYSNASWETKDLFLISTYLNASITDHKPLKYLSWLVKFYVKYSIYDTEKIVFELKLSASSAHCYDNAIPSYLYAFLARNITKSMNHYDSSLKV